jgi:exopolysaccharide biosynthesis polyprenyl glycosylphosphotransferase
VDTAKAATSGTQFLDKYDYLGNLDRFQSIITSRVIDEVFIALPIKSFYNKIEEIVSICTERGIGIRIISDLFLLRNANTSVDTVDKFPLLNISQGPDDAFKLWVKRAVDIFVTVVLLVLLLPFLPIVALVIWLDSTGPVFFIQERVGYNSRQFKLVKFRTMVVNAEEMKSSLMEQNEMDGPVFKIGNDPRITRVGSILRKFSIDELPQLINVLKGDMSLVGPRPPTPDEVQQYSWKQRRRLSVRPGITGLWQVEGRNSVPFEHWVELDLHYIDHWTLGLDFRILLRTVSAVLSRKGAM